MTDIFDQGKRKEIMRKVRNKNTDIEMIIRKLLYAEGYRFRIKNNIFGKPDIVFTKYNVAIFCDGDFWHGKNYQEEKSGYKKFWKDKIAKNIKRDKVVGKTLRKEGWKVIRLWKTDILKHPEKCITKILIHIERKQVNKTVKNKKNLEGL